VLDAMKKAAEGKTGRVADRIRKFKPAPAKKQQGWKVKRGEVNV
jgi:hypothetical protein